MSVSITIIGLENVQKMLDVRRFEKGVDRGLDRAAQILRDETKKMPSVSAKTTGYGAKGMPVDSARLRNSIYSKRLSQLAAGVIAPVKYASYVYHGTGRVPGRPFFRWAIETFGSGKLIAEAFAEEISKAMNAK